MLHTHRQHSSQHPILQDAVNRPYAVAPADLLSFLVRPTLIGDSYLEDPETLDLRKLGGDLGLEAKAIRLDRDPLNHFTSKDLVAGLHVGQVQVGGHVREGREKPISQTVPVVQHAPRLTADEP